MRALLRLFGLVLLLVLFAGSAYGTYRGYYGNNDVVFLGGLCTSAVALVWFLGALVERR